MYVIHTAIAASIQHHKDEFAHRRFDTVDGSTCITDPIKLYPIQVHRTSSQAAL